MKERWSNFVKKKPKTCPPHNCMTILFLIQTIRANQLGRTVAYAIKVF